MTRSVFIYVFTSFLFLQNSQLALASNHNPHERIEEHPLMFLSWVGSRLISYIQRAQLTSREGVQFTVFESQMRWIHRHIPNFVASERSTLLIHLLNYIYYKNHRGFLNFINALTDKQMTRLSLEIANLRSPLLNQHYMAALRHQYEQHIIYKDSLESRYPSWLTHIDITDNRFETQSPELNPDSERELLVGVGADSSFYNLINDNYAALAIRDTYPHVIANMHFKILLLKISGSKDEYFELSSQALSHGTNFNSYQNFITNKIKQSNMNRYIKQFYIFHLQDFINAHYIVTEFWKNTDDFQYTEENLSDEDFFKLKEKAKSGDIHISQGPILDL